MPDGQGYAESVIATIPGPFMVLDTDMRVVTANRSFCTVFCVSREDTEGRLIYEIGDGQWAIPGVRGLLDGIVSNGDPVHDFEVEHHFPDIGRKTLLLNVRRFEWANNRPDLFLLAIEDITERKLAADAVNASEVRYRRLFQAARDGILILDADTLRIIDANPFMTELLGYPYEEFLGKELWELGLFGDRYACQIAYHELQDRGYIRYDHLPLETRDGKQVEVEFVSNVYQEDRRTIAQCNIRDISERSRLERITLEQAAALADLDRRKDEFLAMLSHELRNPLAPILNAVHLLRLQKDEDPLQQQARAIIERQVTQLTRLVDDLMDVVRITSGQVQLRPVRTTVSSIVEHAVETARPLIDQHGHELTVSLPPDPIWLFADAARLEQVVVNLLANADKYTPRGGHIRLTVAQEGSECVLRVVDTGVGIEPELLPRIFDLFTQGTQSLARSQGGLGVGLALVKRLTELHDGTITARSELGRGSEFVVRLPAAPVEAVPSDPKPGADLPTGTALRVLVVDDNKDTAESMAMLLRALGHHARTAYDGPATAQAALNYRPHVILLDIGLPGFDGYEVAKQLRLQPELQGVVLVAVTGYGQESDSRRAREGGFDHHLVKPPDFERLQRILATTAANRP